MANPVDKLFDRLKNQILLEPRRTVKYLRSEPFEPDRRILDQILKGSQTGMELLDYVNGFYPLSEKEWSRFVDGKRYRDIVGSRKPADKQKIVKGLLTVIKEENEPVNPEVAKIVDAAANKDGAAFKSAFDAAITTKLGAALDTTRKDIAQNTFGGIKESK